MTRLVVFFLLSLPMCLAEDSPFSNVKLKATHISGSVYMISGTDDGHDFSGGNIAVSMGSDGVLMIDAKMAPLTDKIMEQIRSIGGDWPVFILNTHLHGDHVGGNPAFQKHSHIIAHQAVRDRLEKDKPEDQWPSITFNDQMTFYFNGEKIQATHYSSGHTDGDVMVMFEGSNVLHMGDQFFSGLFPFIDMDHGGSVNGYIENVKTILDTLKDDTYIIPGHGPLSRKSDLKAFYDMMVSTRDIISDKIKQGKSLEQIQEEGLPETFASYNWDFITTEKWIATLYKGLTRSK